jgi:hypothetical protein
VGVFCRQSVEYEYNKVKDYQRLKTPFQECSGILNVAVVKEELETPESERERREICNQICIETCGKTLNTHISN